MGAEQNIERINPKRGGEIDKARIKRVFSRAASTYDEYAGFQAQMAQRLFELLPKGLSVKRALDVGCATGTVAIELSTRFPTAHITALDISRAMLLRARGKEGNRAGLVSYVVSDFEALAFEEGSFDLLLSNLSYQWADSLAKALEELYRVLAPGGLVLMNTLTSGTLDELRDSFSEAEERLKRSDKRPFISFVEPSTLRKHVEGSGLEVVSFEERSYIREYPGMRELLRVLKKIGAVNPLLEGGSKVVSASLLKAAEENYKLRFPAVDTDGVRATYKTVFILARKPV